MSKTIRIRKGLDIKLKGKPELSVGDATLATQYAIKPSDFPGLTPKLSVKADDIVKVGTPLFYDKAQPEVKFTSPVSGKVVAINRGERRRIMEVEIKSDGKFESEDFSTGTKSPDRETIKQNLLNSGLWPFIIQRPFGVIANATETPRDIFISGFDSSPLAPNFDFTLADNSSEIQAGIDAVAKLTDGKVYLSLREGSKFSSLKGVELNYFDGPHPSGNVGIQMHKLAPLNKGELVWTIDIQALAFIGRLLTTGKLNFEKIVALTGSEVETPKYYKTVLGANIKSIVEGKTTKVGNERIISGNVLTGSQLEEDSSLGFYNNQITVIPEGDSITPFGWIAPGFKTFSAGKTFVSKLFPRKEYVVDANLNGGERAFVISEQYEKVIPMDILPVFLLKSIIVNDIDKMEQLGIYEVIEEDMALCDFVCTSKIEVQELLRKGISTMIKELA
ncbi:MAG: Na(+)-translocating NADH-quinone reductase subunit A [Prolixibacteraceae bacterium]|jgi:Na+-transporting NADH:ubiquinone oxidoreductase subunit A|nr:Na(+)-translocating NADH-quinone reductase subunit A [Prolixibacteraceae bacterium]